MAESLFDVTEPSGADQQIHDGLANIRINNDAMQKLGFGIVSTTITSNAITLADGRPLDVVITGGGTLNTITNNTTIKNGDKLLIVADGTQVTLGTSGNIQSARVIPSGCALLLRWNGSATKWQEVGGGTFELTSNKDVANGYAGLDGSGQILASAHPPLPACRATRTTGLSITASTWTAMLLTSEDFDTDTMHDNATNNSRVTIPTGHGGRYVITACVAFAASAGGSIRGIAISKNGTRIAVDYRTPLSSQPTLMSVSLVDTAAAADYYEVAVYQNSAGALNTDATESNHLAVTRVS